MDGLEKMNKDRVQLKQKSKPGTFQCEAAEDTVPRFEGLQHK
jgi:hypothetical protein